jgi:polyisoprenoid-binding protein YceI
MRRLFSRFAGGILALTNLGLPASDTGENHPPAVTAAVFDVDPEQSRVYIKVAASGRLGHAHGVQGRLASGTITAGGSGALIFTIGSFVVDTPESRQAVGLAGTVSLSDQQKTTATMLGQTVLDAAHYPTADYAIANSSPLDSQTPGDPGRYRLDGRFKLHGVERPLALVAQLNRTNVPGRFRMGCAFAIRQSAYGMTPYSTLGGLIGVADRLEIWGELVIESATH